jgi:hypothetical protein
MYLPDTKSCRTNAISQSGRPRWPTDAFGPEHQAESTHFTCTRVIRELSRDKWAVTSTPSSIRTILGYRSISAKATSACAVRKATIKLNASIARAQLMFISNLRPTKIFASLRNETCWRHIRKPMPRLAAIRKGKGRISSRYFPASISASPVQKPHGILPKVAHPG